MNKLKKMLKEALLLQVLNSIDKIDTVMEKIQTFFCTVIECIVPWAKPSNWAKPFWNSKSNTTMKQMRTFCKTWSKSRKLHDWQAYMKANDSK